MSVSHRYFLTGQNNVDCDVGTHTFGLLIWMNFVVIKPQFIGIYTTTFSAFKNA